VLGRKVLAEAVKWRRERHFSSSIELPRTRTCCQKVRKGGVRREMRAYSRRLNALQGRSFWRVGAEDRFRSWQEGRKAGETASGRRSRSKGVIPEVQNSSETATTQRHA